MRLFFAIIIALNSAFVFLNGAEFYFLDGDTCRFPDTKEGVVLEHVFPFKNTGDEPLIISGYTVACSCTKITFPKDPVLPGKEGELRLTFDTEGKYGFQSRKVLLKTNTKKSIKLQFKVTVVPREER